MLRRLTNKQSGFTMIELMVVMAIIAILSGISIFALQGARSTGRDAKRKADLEDIRSALQLYKADCGEYMSGSLPSGSMTGKASDGCTGGNTYLENVPEDPLDSSAYDYCRGGTGVTYCLCATLENPPTASQPCSCGGGNYCVENP